MIFSTNEYDCFPNQVTHLQGFYFYLFIVSFVNSNYILFNLLSVTVTPHVTKMQVNIIRSQIKS
jgi:hypothetical protein